MLGSSAGRDRYDRIFEHMGKSIGGPEIACRLGIDRGLVGTYPIWDGNHSSQSGVSVSHYLADFSSRISIFTRI